MQGIKHGKTKEIFQKLNAHSKTLLLEQKELAQEHNRISLEYEELNQLKTNMDQYMKRDEKPKGSIVN